ncbi:MAG: hypothetical protein NW237_14155 [Cyanobacteriota bacterium]|nr:hypothetical protein [Cyanobacteriota bacterium]
MQNLGLLCGILLLFLITSCGSSTSSTIAPAAASDSSPLQLSLEVPLPGFASLEVPLIQASEILSVDIPIYSAHYPIIWSSSANPDQVIAQSRSQLTVSPDPCVIPSAGNHTLTATVFNPLDFGLYFPLATTAIPITLDPGCISLSIESVALPATTNDGTPESLKVCVALEDADGSLLLDETGNRPAVSLLFEPQSGTVDPATGSTDNQGCFRTTATLTQNLGTFQVKITAEYQPEPNNSYTLTASDSAQMRDPCDVSDPAEKPFCTCEAGSCPSPSPDPSPDPSPNPSPNPSPSPPPPSPRPSPPPCSNCTPGGSWGEPHVYTFDRLAYDFQSIGEFVLAASLYSDWQIQGRQTYWLPKTRQVAINQAMATRLGSTRLMIDAFADIPLWLDGQPSPLQDGQLLTWEDGSALYYDLDERKGSGWHTYRLIWPDGSQLQAQVRGINGIDQGEARFLDLTLHLPAQLAGSVRGLLGNFNGDPQDDVQTRQGEVLSGVLSFEQIYQSYANSWRISQAESLFDYSPGESTATLTDLNFPQQYVSASTLPEEDYQVAQTACQSAGVPELLLSDCILDVALTGDPKLATVAAETAASLGAENLPTASLGVITPTTPTPGYLLWGMTAAGADIIAITDTAELVRINPQGEIGSIASGLVNNFTFVAGLEEDFIVASPSGYPPLRVTPTGEVTPFISFAVSESGPWIELVRGLASQGSSVWMTLNSQYVGGSLQSRQSPYVLPVGSHLVRVNEQAEATTLWSDLEDPYALGAVTVMGEEVVVVKGNQLLKISPTGQAREWVSLDFVAAVQGLVAGSDRLWLLGQPSYGSPPSLWRISPDGEVSLLLEGLPQIGGMTLLKTDLMLADLTHRQLLRIFQP